MVKLTSADVVEASSTGVYGCWVSIFFSHFYAEGGARDVNTVELDVDIVDTILSRHEPDRVRVRVYRLDETVILNSCRRYNLKRDVEYYLA